MATPPVSFAAAANPPPPIPESPPLNPVMAVAVRALSEPQADVEGLAAQFSQLSLEDQRRMSQTFLETVRRQDVEAVRAAIERGRDAVLTLLREKKVDPSADKNALLEWALEEGEEEIGQILLADPRVDPSACFSLYKLRDDQRVKSILLLLNHPKYHPDDKQWKSYHLWACMGGHLEVVQLLETKRPGVRDDESFKLAAFNGHAPVVAYLLTQEFDPSLEDNIAIRYAGNGAVARLLLADRRVDPKAKNSDALLMASAHGKRDVVQALLDDQRADPTVDFCACLIYGSKYEAVVALLLQDRRVNPKRYDTYDAWFADPERLSRPCTLSERVQIKVRNE